MTLEKTPLQEAQDPLTSTARLNEIWRVAYAAGRFAAVGEAITVHPNTTPDMLRILAKTYPKAVLQNPTLPLILQKDPKWVKNLDAGTAVTLLRFENVPPALLNAFAEDKAIVGKYARLHVGLAGEAGPEDWKADVREALWEMFGARGREPFSVRLLTLDLVPEWLLEPLAGHSDAQVRRAVARHPRTPAALLAPLRRAGSTSDLGGLAPPDLSLLPSVLERLARGGPWAKRLAARHPNTPPDALEPLAESQLTQNRYDKDETLCRYLVQNPGTPTPLRTAIAVQFAEDFRRASARDPNTPPLALAALSADEVRDVRWMAARNPNTPLEALEVLTADPDARVRQGVGRNAAASPPLLARLAADSARWVRLAAARHPLTPPDALALLVKDSDEEVREAVARRSRPAPTRPPASAPQSVPAPASSKLPKAARHQLPPAADPAERVQALEQAGGSASMPIKMTALACPDTALKFLLLGAADAHWACRLAVARNPAAFLLALEMPGTDADLLVLARDGNRLVRAAARAALASAEDKMTP